MKQREVWAGTGGEGNNFLGHHEYLILGSGVEGVETADSGAWFRIKHHPIIFPFRFLLIFLFIKVLRFHQEDRAPESFQPPVDLPKSEMMSSKKLQGSLTEKTLSSEEQQAKINETRKLIGPIADKLPVLCSNASILRFLRAQNWNTKKAGKMLKQTLKWRLEYKPEKIRWEDISHEAETGKVYMANYFDKFGRIVLIMRPGYQNTNSTSGQIRYLVYCMEHAIKNLNLDQEHMVWLIDFQGWNTSSISMKVTRETAHILQHHYPERLGLAILYNPPKVFESFWTMVKPFIEPKTFKKVKFVYPKHPESQKIMEELFDMDKLESGFGGRSSAGFVYQDYAQRMMEDDRKISDLIDSGGLSPSLSSAMSECQQSDSLVTDHCSEASNESSGDEAASSNLEVVDEKIQAHPSPSSNDVANGEALKQQPSNEN